MDIEAIKSAGPEYAANYLHTKGEGVESNPFAQGTREWSEFRAEMQRQQDRQELADIMGMRV